MYHNQVLYTQPNGEQNQAGQGVGSQPSPRFIANNAVREYASQGVVNETIGLAQIAEVKRADAAAALAQAQLEIAGRGLVETVVNLYYGSAAADQKLVVAKRAVSEADAFADLTSKREAAREAAHADVIKAQLEQQQRRRDLSDANILAEKQTRACPDSFLRPAYPVCAAKQPEDLCMPTPPQLSSCDQQQPRSKERTGSIEAERRRSAGGARGLFTGSRLELHLRH